MATSSFDRDFIVKNKEDSDKFIEELKNVQTIKVKPRDIDKESKRGIELLKKLYSV
ncbi:MAG: hypothetical protein AABZ74_17715 [Cyanobacteriota bacterium]